MDIGQVGAWFADPANWVGVNGIPNRLFEHVWLSGLVVLVGSAIAIPVGLAIGHTGRGAARNAVVEAALTWISARSARGSRTRRTGSG